MNAVRVFHGQQARRPYHSLSDREAARSAVCNGDHHLAAGAMAAHMRNSLTHGIQLKRHFAVDRGLDVVVKHQFFKRLPATAGTGQDVARARQL